MFIDDAGRPRPAISPIEFNEESSGSRLEQPRWGLWLTGVGFAAVVLALASFLSPWVRHEWALSIGRQNTPYTQLAFSNVVELPSTSVRGKDIPISFDIANNEGKQVSYRYVVSSGSGSKLQALSSSAKTIANGTTWNVNIAVLPKCAESTCHIKVTLPEQGESINFTISYPNKKK